jgi:hypothetical protein
VVLVCAELPSDSFPSRANGATAKPAGWLSQANSGGRPAAQSAHTHTACRKGLSPRSPALSPSAPQVCASPATGSSADFGNCDSCFPAHDPGRQTKTAGP